MIALILNGTWPLSAIVLCITNDFVWWIPFGRYLFDAWPLFRADIMSSSGADLKVGPTTRGHERY